MADADGSLVRWLEIADAQPSIREIKRAMLELAPVGEGDRVLDVGCGIGLEATRLSRRVGSGGRVVGIDKSAQMVAEASRRRADEELNVEYAVMDARRLEFPDGAFDLCRTERVLRYVEDPGVAVEQMARVTRPGGRVVAFDFDSDATVIDAPDTALVRRVREVLDAAVPSCWIGRQLPRLFRRAGLIDIVALPQVVRILSLDAYRRLVGGTLEAAARAGDFPARDLARWWDDLERLDSEDGVFVFNLGFVVCGTKPMG